MTTLDELEALVAAYQYVDENRIVLTVGIRSTFYFWGGHTAAKRQALVECVEAYEKCYGTNLTWTLMPSITKSFPFQLCQLCAS